jgi:ribonuclease P protein component
MRRGKRSRTVHLDVFDSPSPASFARAGLVVPRHSQRAVDRNRVKRRLREALRLEVLPRLDGAELNIDVLVRARSEAYAASWQALRAELVEWTDRRCSRGQ